MQWERSPTLEVLAVFAVVFLLQRLGGLVGLPAAWFVLSAPLAVQPWTLVTSVYAHASLGHLAANAIGLAVVGFALERFTTRPRFHAFVLVTGMLAGVAEVLASGVLGRPTGVLGASGAVLALFGYAFSGNRLTGSVLSRLDPSRRVRVALFVGAALLVTLATAGRGVALIAHFTGFAAGVTAGRLGLLGRDW